MTTYHEYNEIPQDGEFHKLSLDVVLFKDETVEDAVKSLTKSAPNTSWEQKYSGNCWPQIDFTGPRSELWHIQQAYHNDKEGSE